MTLLLFWSYLFAVTHPRQCSRLKLGKVERKITLLLYLNLKDIGLETSFYTIEISSLDHTNSDTINALKSIYNVIESTASTTSLVNQLLENSAKISVACFQTIFYACKNTLWEDRPLFKLQCM